MSTLTQITEKELEREIKNKGDVFCLKNNMTIYIGGEKMRNASGQQREASKVKMSGSERKANRNTDQLNKSSVSTYDIFFPIKCVTRKFHVVVVQNNGKEMYKKVCCTCEVVFCY